MKILKIIILFYSAIGLAFGSDHGYFPENYKDSRTKFLNESQKIKSQFGDVASLKSFETPSLQKEKLFTDFLYLDCRQYAPKKNSASRPLILLTSGVHGPESRVGTAAQIWFLKNEARKRCKAGISQIYFHSLNPFGFHHDRRFTENNVDLNRNFPTSDDIYENENAGYKNLEEILNPKKPVGSLLLRSASLFKKLLGKLVGGLDQAAIRQASVGGQYEYPKGIYFGGNHPEPVVKFVSIALKESFRNHSNVLHYDFHTGLGEKGILHMIVGPSLSGYGGEKIEKVFKPLSTGRFELTTSDDPGFYKVEGDITDYISSLKTDGKIVSFTVEYGTVGLGLFAQLKTLTRIVNENQGHFHGYKSDKIKRRVKKRLRDVFHPPKTSWLDVVQETNTFLLTSVIDRFIESL